MFSAGCLASNLIQIDLPAKELIAALTGLGAFVGVIYNRFKHLDDLKLARKKEASLEYVKFSSQHTSAILNFLTSTKNTDELTTSLLKAINNLTGALDSYHVVSDDDISSQIEALHCEKIMLATLLQKKHLEFKDKPIELIQWFLQEDIGLKISSIRYKTIELINLEIGDKTGNKKLKSVIENNNIEIKKMLNNLIINSEQNTPK